MSYLIADFAGVHLNVRDRFVELTSSQSFDKLGTGGLNTRKHVRKRLAFKL